MIDKSTAGAGNTVEHGLVCIRSGGAEAIHRGINQLRVTCMEPVIVETHLRQCRTPVVGQKDIGFFQQGVNCSDAVVCTDIETDGSLATIDGDKLWTHGAVRRFVLPAPAISAGVTHGRFHLDDVSTHISQVEPGSGPLDGDGHFDDCDSVKRFRHVPLPLDQDVMLPLK